MRREDPDRGAGARREWRRAAGRHRGRGRSPDHAGQTPSNTTAPDRGHPHKSPRTRGPETSTTPDDRRGTRPGRPSQGAPAPAPDARAGRARRTERSRSTGRCRRRAESARTASRSDSERADRGGAPSRRNQTRERRRSAGARRRRRGRTTGPGHAVPRTTREPAAQAPPQAPRPRTGGPRRPRAGSTHRPRNARRPGARPARRTPPRRRRGPRAGDAPGRTGEAVPDERSRRSEPPRNHPPRGRRTGRPPKPARSGSTAARGRDESPSDRRTETRRPARAHARRHAREARPDGPRESPRTWRDRSRPRPLHRASRRARRRGAAHHQRRTQRTPPKRRERRLHEAQVGRAPHTWQRLTSRPEPATIRRNRGDDEAAPVAIEARREGTATSATPDREPKDGPRPNADQNGPAEAGHHGRNRRSRLTAPGPPQPREEDSSPRRAEPRHGAQPDATPGGDARTLRPSRHTPRTSSGPVTRACA